LKTEIRLLEEIYSSMLNSTNHNSKKIHILKKKEISNQKQKTKNRRAYNIWINNMNFIKTPSNKLRKLHDHRSKSNITLLRFDHPSIILTCYACNQKILFLYFYWLYYKLDYVNQASACSSCVYYDHLFMLPPCNQGSTYTCCV
jgi:hypothetical protein